MELRMAKYNIEAGNSYNMDKKGFMAGVIGRQKKVFSKASYKRKRLR